MSRKFLLSGCAALILGSLAVGLVTADPPAPVQFGGYTNAVSVLANDGNGAVVLTIDVNGDFGGSTHDGTVICPRPVRIVSEQHLDGGGHYDGSVSGNVYTWHTQCGSFAGIHEKVTLAY
jgi:hypothetical protein